MMCAGVKPPGDNWIRTGKWMSASVIWTSVHNIAHNWWWSVRSEICRIGDRNYLRLPTADFERMSHVSTRCKCPQSHCRATWWSAVASWRVHGGNAMCWQRACVRGAGLGGARRGALRQLPADAVWCDATSQCQGKWNVTKPLRVRIVNCNTKDGGEFPCLFNVTLQF